MSGPVVPHIGFELDAKYQKFLKDLKGWKVLPDGLYHSSDRIAKGTKIGTGSGIRYDESRIRVALFGLGTIGTVHVETLLHNPDIKLVYCVEAVPERINYMRYRWHLDDVKMIHPNDDKLVFDDPEVDAVVIGTPTFTHGELIMKALRAGKAVFCEKPLSDDYQVTERCYRLAIGKNIPLFCAFNRRFDSTFRLIKERVRHGDIGKIRLIKMCSRDCTPPPLSYIKISKGIFHDQGIHDIDLIIAITGELPIMVTATGSAFMEGYAECGDWDVAAAMIKFASGTIAMIDLSRNAAYGYDQRLEVFGERGMLTNSNPKPSEVTMESTIGTIKVPNYYSFVSRFTESYANELNHFVDCVKGDSEVEVKAWECLASWKIAQACTDSARANGKPIELSWKEDWFRVEKEEEEKCEEE
ncbi:inositol 2-dehydrogenase-like [Brevipalpus obovatus]|uniref:inositol 2-dehydrogenase-like n=1 Tax=Brevipalpus obovatus TaxID=246614 RepID=UPI003D9EE363